MASAAANRENISPSIAKEEWSGEEEEEDEDEELEGEGSGSRKRKRQRTSRPISVSCEKCKERKVRLSERGRVQVIQLISL